MNWYYESAGQQQGPVPESDIRRLLAEGTISPATVIWREGMDTWRPLREALPELLTPPAAPGVSLDKPFPTAPPFPTGEAIPPGHVRCSLTGKVIPESEAVYIGGKPYSADAKTTVLQSLQQGGTLPTTYDGARTGPAWESRSTLGWPKAAWETTKAVLTMPNATFGNMRQTGDLWGPVIYYVIIATVFSVIAQSFYFLLPLADGNPGEPSFISLMLTQAAIPAWLLVFMPLFIGLGAFLTAGLQHLALKVLGYATQPFETTLRTYLYCNGAAAVFMFVPICGSVVAAIWGIVVNCIALSRTHDISMGRAVFGVLAPMILGCAVGLIGAVAIMAIAGAAAAASSQ